MSFEKQFYTLRFNKKINKECIYGFPMVRGAWCNSKLKMQALNAAQKTHLRGMFLSNSAKTQRPEIFRNACGVSALGETLVQQRIESKCIEKGGFFDCSLAQGANTNIVQYLGIAADEPKRIARHKDRQGIVLPLVDIGWDEDYCRQWCEENDLLSPIYANATRGGCWFCHNQSVNELRLLRKDYPELWEILLKWDLDSPVTFHPDGHTVHDFDLRFYAEDLQLIPSDRKFRWNMLDNLDNLK